MVYVCHLGQEKCLLLVEENLWYNAFKELQIGSYHGVTISDQFSILFPETSLLVTISYGLGLFPERNAMSKHEGQK